MPTHPPLTLVLALALVPLAGCSTEHAPLRSQTPANERPTATTAPTDMTHAEELPPMFDIPLETLSGNPTDLACQGGKALMIVNVASQCGLTPQYAGLEKLQKTYGKRGFVVLGFPCNQFGGQEPGTADEIATFCETSYGVTFPMMAKVEVNGPDRHPLYEELVAVPDAEGKAGDVQWNFEKFVVSADGSKIVRFRPRTTPDAPEVIAAIEAALPH
jgi:glutathione peroxidase